MPRRPSLVERVWWTIKIRPGLKQRVQDRANDLVVSPNLVIEAALEDYLARSGDESDQLDQEILRQREREGT